MTKEQQIKCLEIIKHGNLTNDDIQYLEDSISSVHCAGKQEKIIFRLYDKLNNYELAFAGTRKEVIEKFGKDPHHYLYTKSYINRRYRIER